MRVAAALTADNRGPWATELGDIVRAASGGLLFGIPLLYTMEMWWIGSQATPAQSIALLLLTLGPVMALNRTSGFRTTKDTTFRDAAIDTVEAVGIGILMALVVLVVLRQITTATPAPAAAAKLIYEAMPFSFGVAVANHFLRGDRVRDDDAGSATAGGESTALADNDGDGDDDALSATVADIGATFAGSTFVALNIAPTQEVPMLAAATGARWQIAIIVLSLLASYAIVFVAEFSGQAKRLSQKGILQRPLTETMVSYLIALIGAAVMLFAFQQLHGPWTVMLANVVILGLPAAIGGAAGRLAI